MTSFSYSAPRVTPEQLEDEFNAMSIEERDQVARDVYGRELPFEESSQFLQEKLRSLDEKLQIIGTANDQNVLDNEVSPLLVSRESFETAQMICPEYVNGDEFSVMFLRSTKFDVELAAKKIVNYWSQKVDLFGPDRAFRKLTLEDLDRSGQDVVALSKGGMRALPLLDEANRGILWSHRAFWDCRPGFEASMLRLLWYTTHVLVENEDVQKNGVVMVITNGLAHSNYSGKLNRRMCRALQESLPIKVQAFHQAGSCEIEVTTIRLQSILFALQPKLRAKFQFHTVQNSDVAGVVEPYGILSHALPPELGGDLDWEWEEWLQERRRIEGNA